MHRTEIADSTVRATARPETDPDDPRTWSWVAASVWTDRMLAALGNGVRGGTAATMESAPAQAGETSRLCPDGTRSPALAQCLLR